MSNWSYPHAASSCDDDLSAIPAFRRRHKRLGEALLDEFPWTSFLSPSDREAFIDDFTRTVVAAAELDSFGALAQMVEEWRATAEIHADPKLARRLRSSIVTKGKPVPRPAS